MRRLQEAAVTADDRLSPGGGSASDAGSRGPKGSAFGGRGFRKKQTATLRGAEWSQGGGFLMGGALESGDVAALWWGQEGWCILSSPGGPRRSQDGLLHQ